MWPILWLRFLAWWHSEPETAPLPVFSQADLDAINAMNAPPKEGWYAWECAQYRASGAPWFDPHRYDGTRFAYHRPTTDDLVANYEGSSAEAMAKYGREEVDAATWWVYQQSRTYPEMEDGHRESLDPIGWCIAAYREAGSPRIDNVPSNWSAAAPSRREPCYSPAQVWRPGEYKVVDLQRAAQAQHNAYQNALGNAGVQNINELLRY